MEEIALSCLSEKKVPAMFSLFFLPLPPTRPTGIFSFYVKIDFKCEEIMSSGAEGPGVESECLKITS